MSATSTLVEAAERAAWIDLLAAAPATARDALGIEITEVGGGVALSARGTTSVLVNRAIGIRTDAATLIEVADHFRARQIERFFVHASQVSIATDDAAARAGLARYPRAWLQLARGDAPVAALASSLRIDDASADDLAAAAPIYGGAFDLPASFTPVVAALAGRPGWHAFVARDGEVPVGLGLLRVDGLVGYLAGGATAPSHRRRGAQGALVAARVARARALGCRWVATETGEEIPGEPQHSFRNLRRAGFEVVGRRENYAPAAIVRARVEALAAAAQQG
jgi:ribosomal protein S18 acetylase RimI-like enzyme